LRAPPSQLAAPPSSPSQIELHFTGLSNPNGAAVDTTGNGYVADNYRALKLPARG
jgi:hypothetical protein